MNYQKIEKGIIDGYKKIEEGVVNGYLKIQDGMGFAYPVNRKCYNKVKKQHLPRILELTAELAGEVY